MGRLIDADLLMEAYLHDKKSGAVSMVKLIEEAPTIDAVEVVRCKDCIYRDYSICYAHFAEVYVRGDDYCSRGRRKEDER